MEADRDRTRLLAEEMSGLACATLAREDVEQVKRLHVGYRAQHGLSKKRALSGGWPRCFARRQAPETNKRVSDGIPGRREGDNGRKRTQGGLRQFLAAIKGGDGQTMMSLLADDAVVVLPGSFKVAWAGRWQGREPIKQCFHAIGALLDIRDHTVNLMFGEGEHVMVLIDETSAAKNTGRLLHQETAWYFCISNGEIAHWQAYEDTEQIAWVWDDSG